jgi:N-glycosylase/DNA lyase
MNTDEAKSFLMKFKGIGGKVSDLILMYGFGRCDVFPLDIWVKRALKREYFRNNNVSDKELYKFAREYFGNFASIINIMIFTYERRNKSQFYNYCVWR